MTRNKSLLLYALLASFLQATPSFAHHKDSKDLSSGQFDPWAFDESNVVCQAIDRQKPDDEKIVDININYIDVNEAKLPRDTIIMVHGWPGLWSIWSNQIMHYRDKYRILAPNLRGFSKSGHPGDVHSGGSYADFTSDLICLLDNAGIKDAICLGHDWGSQLCFEAARLRPDRFKAVIGLAVPYFPSVGMYLPTAHLWRLAPKLAYQGYFADRTKEAAAELDANPRKVLRAVVRAAHNPTPEHFLTSATDFLGVFGDEELEPIDMMSSKEEDYFVEGMKRGFELTLQFYVDGNRSRSHALAKTQGNHTIDTPSLLIIPTKDRVANWREVLERIQMERFMTDLAIRDIETAHWPHMEAPEEVNQFIDEFLDELASRKQHVPDEL